MMTTIAREPWASRCRPIAAYCVAIGAGLLLGEAAAAQATSMVKGVVRDSAARVGLNAVEVRLDGSGQRAFTNERGEFRLSMPVPNGRLIVRRLGYRPDTVDVRGGAGDVQLVLAPAVLRLDRVVVIAEHGRYSGRLAGYYERLERGTQGKFITRADLEREKPSQLTDMLQRQPGVHLSRGRPGPARLQMRGRECLPLIWLDGAALSVGSVDLDAFAPTTLEGIELYLGSNVPSRYTGVRGQTECGAILLWSRGPDTEPKHLGASITPEALEAMIRAQAVYTAEQVDSVARTDGAHRPDVAYPPSLRAAQIEGTVLAEFVVDTTGRVEQDHFGIVGSTDPLFSSAVRDALLSTLFRPAMLRGRRVRQLVREPFEFRLPTEP
jgi:TonB family protein